MTARETLTDFIRKDAGRLGFSAVGIAPGTGDEEELLVGTPPVDSSHTPRLPALMLAVLPLVSIHFRMAAALTGRLSGSFCKHAITIAPT